MSNIKLLAVAALVLTGCTSTEPLLTVDSEINTIESKVRTYPQHIRNGVVIEQSQTWYLGTTDSFLKRAKDPEPQKIIDDHKFDPLHKNASELRETVMAASGIKDETGPGTHKSQKDFGDFQLSQSFFFEKRSNNLTDESRERLVHHSPKWLPFQTLHVSATKKAEEPDWFTRYRINQITEELLHAGVRPSHIEVKMLVSKLEDPVITVTADKNLKVSTEVLEFKDTKEPVAESVSKLLSGKDPQKIAWVRIASSKQGQSLIKALKTKAALIEKGVDPGVITILHRQKLAVSVELLIYEK